MHMCTLTFICKFIKIKLQVKVRQDVLGKNKG